MVMSRRVKGGRGVQRECEGGVMCIWKSGIGRRLK